MNLSNVDLDLFVVLHAVLEEGSATRAAARLHVTRPAVSNALARLRRLLGDPLLVRHGRGFMPTPRALELAPRLAAALEQLQGVLQTRPFDPARSTRRFSIASSDYGEVAVLPKLMELFERRLPRATLRVITIDQLLAQGALGSGDVDVVIGMFPTTPPGCQVEQLFCDELVCVLRDGHPHRGGVLTLDELCSLGEIEISLFADRPSTGARMGAEVMSRHGRTRSIAFSVPHFTAAVLAAVRSDHVTIVPRRLAEAFAVWLPIQILALPLDFPPLPICQLWPARSEHDPGSRMLRELIREGAPAVTSPARNATTNGRARATTKSTSRSRTRRPPLG